VDEQVGQPQATRWESREVREMLEAIYCGTHFGNFFPCVLSYTQLKTKYTVAANPPPGYLCHPCTKASGTDPFKKPASPRKRKTAAEKRAITHVQERKFPTLVSFCIKVCIR
jgi:DNA repair protein RAD7